jgi:predicted PurR-regulated permease PerM
MMKFPRWNVYFFLALLVGVGYLMFAILQPFLTALLVAAVLAVFFQGLYQWMVRLTRGREVLSASVMLLLIALVIVIPITLIVLAALTEASILYTYVGSGGLSWNQFHHFTQSIDQSEWWMRFSSGRSVEDILGVNTFLSSARDISNALLGFLQALYQGVAGALFWLFTMFFALFYFFIDGHRAVRFFMRISPLRDVHEAVLIRDFVSMSRATIKGTLVIAFIQGLLGGIAFLIAGIPSPATWGLVMAFLSLIPFLGSGIVWLPAGIILLVIGHVWQGVWLLAFGFGIVSSIDNFLRPRFVGRDTQIHPLLVLFATLGGLSLFGLVGFLVGPIIAALFISLVNIYDMEFKTELDRYNQ